MYYKVYGGEEDQPRDVAQEIIDSVNAELTLMDPRYVPIGVVDVVCEECRIPDMRQFHVSGTLVDEWIAFHGARIGAVTLNNMIKTWCCSSSQPAATVAEEYCDETTIPALRQRPSRVILRDLDCIASHSEQ